MTGFHACIRRWAISVLCLERLLMLVRISPRSVPQHRAEGMGEAVTSLYIYFLLNAQAEYCGLERLHGMTWSVCRTGCFISNINI